MMLSDRRRVESALLPRLLLGIVNNGGFLAVDDDGQPIKGGGEALASELHDLLTTASLEPVADLEPARAAKLARRVDRLADHLFDEWRGGSAAKWALVVMMVTRDLHDSGRLVMTGGAAMHTAYCKFAPVLDDALEDDTICRSATRHAAKLRQRLAREGYYRDD
jgi:hypothetical protein